MRIPTLAERPRFYEAGKIKIGRKSMQARQSQSGPWYPPEKLDHFLITQNTRSDKINLDLDLEAMEHYGGKDGKPNKLSIVLMFNPVLVRGTDGRVTDIDISANFISFLSFYASRSCACRMNEAKPGETQTATRFFKGSQRLETPLIVQCNPSECPDHPQNRSIPDKSARCKATGILRCMLQHHPRVGGVYVLRTHSWNSINNIDSSLRQIAAVTGGLLCGIPLDLTLTPKQARTADDKTVVIYELNISYPDSIENLMEMSKSIADTKQRLTVDPKVVRGYLELLEETPEEQKEVNEEFSPETVEQPPFDNGQPRENTSEPPTTEPTNDELLDPEQIVMDFLQAHQVPAPVFEAMKIQFVSGDGTDWSRILDELVLGYGESDDNKNSTPQITEGVPAK